MSYRYRFHSVPKTEIEKIRKCTTNVQLCLWAEKQGYKVKTYDENDRYMTIYDIGKEIYEFGTDEEWAYEIQEKNESIFSSEELKELYIDYQPVICSQNDFLSVINAYKQKIINYYKSLLIQTKDSVCTPENKQRKHIEDILYEWDNGYCCPIDTDMSHNRINNSWLYEYSIFELVRLYKTFDWENDELILLGW